MSARSDLLAAADAMAKKGQTIFSPAELIAEARARGSTYPDTTLRTHIVSNMCINASSASGGTYPDLVRTARGVYRLRDGRDGPVVSKEPRSVVRSPWTPRTVRARANCDALVASFGEYLEAFEAQEVFEGPSLYFHLKAIERRSLAPSAAALLKDESFLEYVYAVLPSWGMHRMGDQAAKVPAFELFAGSLRACEAKIDRLWRLNITELDGDKLDEVGLDLWDIIAALRSSTSKSRLVSGSKTLHHVLPALMPPIDREYTYRFFGGLANDERESFLAWWPLLCEIGRRCTAEINAAVGRPEAMATSPSKVIDNAIVGFRVRQKSPDTAH